MKKTLLFLSLLVASFTNNTGWAQTITVNARIDSTIIKIGDQAHLSFEISQQPNQKVILPVFSDSIKGGLELVEPVRTDTVKSAGGKILVTQHCVVTAFKDSLLYVPPFPFVLNGDTVWSKSLSLKVVQPFKIDTAASSITDIKPVMDPKFDWMGLFKIVLLVVVIIGILLLVWFLYRKYFKKQRDFDDNRQELLLPPHVVAINCLDKIKQEKAWQHGRSKEYHTQLTEVLREYIERVFYINSMEMTSDEILEQFRFMRIEQKSVYQSLQQILKLADLVKFAKFDPAPDENELSLMNAYLFVNQTKMEDVKPLDEIRNEE